MMLKLLVDRSSVENKMETPAAVLANLLHVHFLIQSLAHFWSTEFMLPCNLGGFVYTITLSASQWRMENQFTETSKSLGEMICCINKTIK